MRFVNYFSVQIMILVFFLTLTLGCLEGNIGLSIKKVLLMVDCCTLKQMCEGQCVPLTAYLNYMR